MARKYFRGAETVIYSPSNDRKVFPAFLVLLLTCPPGDQEVGRRFVMFMMRRKTIFFCLCMFLLPAKFLNLVNCFTFEKHIAEHFRCSCKVSTKFRLGHLDDIGTVLCPKSVWRVNF